MTGLRNWLTRNAEPLAAMGAIATAFAALTAVVVIPYQLSQTDLIQRDQTAREIYREFLNLTVQKPELASADYCALDDPVQKTAYGAYVDYLVYTAEQMIDTSAEWTSPMANYLADHMTYICSPENMQSQGIKDLLADLSLSCETARQCG